jgi:hypothetical protein
MSKRGLAIVLVLLFAVSAAALYQIFRFDRIALTETAAATDRLQSITATNVMLSNLRAAQLGVIAANQGPDVWSKRIDPLFAEIERSISTLAGRTTSHDARAQYDAAMASLGVLRSFDRQARDRVNSQEPLVALDVVLADEKDSAQQLAAKLDAAFAAERAGLDARLADIQLRRLGLEGGALAILLLTLIALASRRPRTETVTVIEPAQPVPDELEEYAGPAVPAASEPASPSVRLDLGEAANVCVDLARVLDGRDVPPLLTRAADVIGAKGVVLWVADAGGTWLQPSLAHGYSEQFLARMGNLEVAADNITSRAFRSLQPQALDRADGGGNALAIPLITASGAVGVLAAELDPSATARDTIAVARMFAAQLATLVGPMPEAAAQAAEG